MRPEARGLERRGSRWLRLRRACVAGVGAVTGAGTPSSVPRAASGASGSSSGARAACLAWPSTAMSPGRRPPLVRRPTGPSAQQHGVAQRSETLGDGVDRGGGDNKDTEDQEHDQPQVGQPDPDGGHDRSGDQPADPASGRTQRLGPVTRAGRALGQRPDPARGGQQDPGPDRQPTSGGALVRVAEYAQRGPEQEQRDHDVQGPDGPGHDGGDEAGQPAVDREPGDSGDDDRQGEQQQADPVAAVRRIEVAGAAPERARHPTEDRGEEQPGTAQRPAELRGRPGRRGPGCGGQRASARCAGPSATRCPEAGRIGLSPCGCPLGAA